MRIAQQLTAEMESALKRECRTAWKGRDSTKVLESELFVSVVDTAGFEALSDGANRFEQLLANYTAEKFRHLCDEVVIKTPFQLYDAELLASPVLSGAGVPWSPLFGNARTGDGGRFPWKSNVIALELLEKGLQPIGLLEQIENSAQYARVTTEKLRTDIQTQTGATVPWGQLLTWPRQSFSASLDFGVKHTWGEVTYSVGDAQDISQVRHFFCLLLCLVSLLLFAHVFCLLTIFYSFISQTLSFIEAGKGEYSTMLRGVKALLGDTALNGFVRDAFAGCASNPVGAAAKQRPAGPPFFGKRFKTELNAITRAIKVRCAFPFSLSCSFLCSLCFCVCFFSDHARHTAVRRSVGALHRPQYDLAPAVLRVRARRVPNSRLGRLAIDPRPAGRLRAHHAVPRLLRRQRAVLPAACEEVRHGSPRRPAPAAVRADGERPHPRHAGARRARAGRAKRYRPGEFLLCTVTFYANLAHNLTRSP